MAKTHGTPWLLKAGTLVSVCRDSDQTRRWQSHTLTRDVIAREVRSKDCFGDSGAIILLEMGWLILTRRNAIRQMQSTQCSDESHTQPVPSAPIASRAYDSI